MAGRTAVIDIGSNSARLVIFQKTSRFGFHLLAQHKSRVRIGEGAYHQQGYLQPVPMERAFETLRAFAGIVQEYRVTKTLCVATSALRDAPNRSEFVDRVRRELGIRIRVIDGKEEARYGALAAANLLPPEEDAITIDIGGGSADMALLHRGRIVETCSLDLGTVRLKELFTRDQIDRPAAEAFIQKALQRLPETFTSKVAIGIGGTTRALARGMMESSEYPFDKLHAYTYILKEKQPYLDRIITADPEILEALMIPSGRFDTIREGTLIFRMILEHIGARKIVTSGVGVREGVYLHDRLRKHKDRFPRDINPSIVSIRDRIDILDLPSGNKRAIGHALFGLFADAFGGTKWDETMLMHALSLSDIGKMLTIYKEHHHAFYVALHELNYGFTHEEMVLIAMILRSKGKKYHKELFRRYKTLLPKKKRLKWLIFLHTLTLIIHENAPKAKVRMRYRNNVLRIEGDFAPYLIREQVGQIHTPGKIRIEIKTV